MLTQLLSPARRKSQHVRPVLSPKRVTLITPPSIFLLDERVFMSLGILKVAAVLEKAGHRKILLGSQGEMIKDIRQSAQRELKKMLQRPVRLALHIKVEEDWRDRPDQLDKLHLE